MRQVVELENEIDSLRRRLSDTERIANEANQQLDNMKRHLADVENRYGCPMTLTIADYSVSATGSGLKFTELKH